MITTPTWQPAYRLSTPLAGRSRPTPARWTCPPRPRGSDPGRRGTVGYRI